METEQIKHLEFIQNSIIRMNSNSFQLKGWMITVVAALLAIYADSKNSVFIAVAVFPVLLFWLLDAFYLQQERKFRGIYNDVAGISKGEGRQSILPFEIPLEKYNGGSYSYYSSFKSKTIAPLYGLISVFLIIGSIILCSL
jgi:hypothetical protein